MTTVLASDVRRAAHGKHRCVCCHENIVARERYLDMRVAGDGHVWTQRHHLACVHLLNRYACAMGLEEEDWPDWDEVLLWAQQEAEAQS